MEVAKGRMRFSGVTMPTLRKLNDVAVGSRFINATPNPDAIKPALLICPGGAYRTLSTTTEGFSVAQWADTVGFRPFVLFYSVPSERPAPAEPLREIQRAVRMMRANAKEWKIDSDRIVVMGFSAGGHLAASISVRHDLSTDRRIDRIDEFDPRPNFTILMYPAYLNDERSAKSLAKDLRPFKRDLPPMLVVSGKKDRNYIQSSETFVAALKQTAAKYTYAPVEDAGHGWSSPVLSNNPAIGRPQPGEVYYTHVLPWLRDNVKKEGNDHEFDDRLFFPTTPTPQIPKPQAPN